MQAGRAWAGVSPPPAPWLLDEAKPKTGSVEINLPQDGVLRPQYLYWVLPLWRDAFRCLQLPAAKKCCFPLSIHPRNSKGMDGVHGVTTPLVSISLDRRNSHRG
jgi:hypothetical protein